MAILSRAGLDDVRRGFPGEPGFPDPEARAISATCAGCRVWSVYVPNGRALDSPHLAYKLSWLAALRGALAWPSSARGRRPARLAVCGDFNIAPPDDDVWDPAAFVGSTHVTPEERAALAGLLDLGLTDVPARALKGEPFTYWDYRAGMFHKGMGMRIDLVLASAPVAAGGQGRLRGPGGPQGQGPSDHAPIVVDLDLDPARITGVTLGSTAMVALSFRRGGFTAEGEGRGKRAAEMPGTGIAEHKTARLADAGPVPGRGGYRLMISM